MADIPNAQQFSLEQLPIPQQDVVDPDGQVINPPQARGGAPIPHWMDAQLATAWFQEAARLRDIANNPSSNLRCNVIASVITALMNGYNAMNIEWQMHPAARALWRKYISGQPESLGGQPIYAEYGNHDYNSKWLTWNSPFPAYTVTETGYAGQPLTGNPAVGIITAQAVDLIARVPELANSKVGIVHSYWPFQYVPGYISTNPGEKDPTYAQIVANNSTGTGRFVDERDVTSRGGPYDPENQYVYVSGDWTVAGYVPPRERSVNTPAGPDLSSDHPVTRDTPVFSFDDNPTARTLRLAQFPDFKTFGVPCLWYLPWISEWVDAVNSDTPQNIAAQSRLYTAYWNQRSSDQYGGASNFLGGVINLPSFLERQATDGEAQRGLRVAAAASAAIGSTLAPATMGISGLIGGALSLGLGIAGSVVRNNPNAPRDEFGRFKPILERGWLGGNPALTDDTGKPPLNIPGPAGFARTNAPGTSPFLIPPILQHVQQYLHPGPSVIAAALSKPGAVLTGPPAPPVVPPPTTTSSTITTFVIITAIAAAAYVGYRLLVKPKQTQVPARRNPPGRRRVATRRSRSITTRRSRSFR